MQRDTILKTSKDRAIEQLLIKIVSWFRRRDWWYEIREDENGLFIYARAELGHENFRIQIRFDERPGYLYFSAMPEFSISEDRRSQALEYMNSASQGWRVDWGNGSVICSKLLNFRNHYLSHAQIDKALGSVCHQMKSCLRGLFQVVIFGLDSKDAFIQTVTSELTKRHKSI